ncbi:hypothetical protein B0J14DRAFT_658038 [Halenospora varia]|nr:hypothetical protein B0J14DRAFT_658038 [Halenospora varia]
MPSKNNEKVVIKIETDSDEEHGASTTLPKNRNVEKGSASVMRSQKPEGMMGPGQVSVAAQDTPFWAKRTTSNIPNPISQAQMSIPRLKPYQSPYLPPPPPILPKCHDGLPVFPPTKPSRPLPPRPAAPAPRQQLPSAPRLAPKRKSDYENDQIYPNHSISRVAVYSEHQMTHIIRGERMRWVNETAGVREQLQADWEEIAAKELSSTKAKLEKEGEEKLAAARQEWEEELVREKEKSNGEGFAAGKGEIVGKLREFVGENEV